VPRGYVGSRGPVNVGWQLTEALRRYGGYEREETVFPFYYDWRLPARDNALQLRDFIEGVRRGRKVDIVTHSAGGLIALTLVKLLGGGDLVENLILVAPTREGVVDAFRIMVRPERFIRRRFTPDLVATWPSVPELLPEDGRFLVGEDGRATTFDAWNPASWNPIIPPELHDRFAGSLARARAFRDELRDVPLPGNVRLTIIAGDCVPTARRVLSRDDGTLAFYPSELREDEQRLQSTLFEPGDGTVPVSSAGGGSAAILFCDGHQGIASDPNVHRALIRLLRGTR
jgi:prepilin-type processing-associated H-X9-DG protein